MRTGAHGTGERIRRSTVPVSRWKLRKKKGVSASAAWREARALIWAHRRRLAIGPALDARQPAGGPRAAGDVQVPDRRRRRARTGRPAADARAGGRRRDARPGGHLVRPVADPRRRRAARDHRHAQARAGARHAAAGPLLRLDADRRADLAHHDRRRRHPEPRRHGPRAAVGGLVTAVHRRWASCSG